jgi:DNA-binding NarL/FixJ family response regulator
MENSSMAISILLVDDFQVFRDSVRFYLSTYPEFCLVGEASNGKDALLLADTLHPDVVLVDWMMPGMNGMETTRELLKQNSDAKIIILSMQSEDAYLEFAALQGAKGYVEKEEVYLRLGNAILEVASGGSYFKPSFRGQL